MTKMTVNEEGTWQSFKSVRENFLGNKKSENYKELVEEMLKNFKKFGLLDEL